MLNLNKRGENRGFCKAFFKTRQALTHGFPSHRAGAGGHDNGTWGIRSRPVMDRSCKTSTQLSGFVEFYLSIFQDTCCSYSSFTTRNLLEMVWAWLESDPRLCSRFRGMTPKAQRQDTVTRCSRCAGRGLSRRVCSPVRTCLFEVFSTLHCFGFHSIFDVGDKDTCCLHS